MRPFSFQSCGFSASFVTHGIEGEAAGAGAPRCYSLSVPFGLQLWEVFLVLLVVLLVFGPKRLPEMGRSLGKGMREFKDSISGKDDDEPVHEPGHESRQRDTVS